jgi:hypothetical protein
MQAPAAPTPAAHAATTNSSSSVVQAQATPAPDPNAEDDTAFTAARSRNTMAALSAYLQSYPNGRHAGDARAARERLVLNQAPTLDTVEYSLRGFVASARHAAQRAVTAAERARSEGSSRSLGSVGLYEGEWSSNEANGAGMAKASGGDQYLGYWRRSQFDGAGVLIYANGVVFEGEFENGAPTSRGVFWAADGQRLTGRALFAALIAR